MASENGSTDLWSETGGSDLDRAILLWKLSE